MYSREKILKPITPFDILNTWSQIIYDLVHPKGRSVYDAFWKDDRSYFAGASLIILSLGVFFGVLVKKIIEK